MHIIDMKNTEDVLIYVFKFVNNTDADGWFSSMRDSVDMLDLDNEDMIAALNIFKGFVDTLENRLTDEYKDDDFEIASFLDVEEMGEFTTLLISLLGLTHIDRMIYAEYCERFANSINLLKSYDNSHGAGNGGWYS